MALWRHLTHGLRVLTRRAAADREIDDELRHWMDEATAQHVARGLTPDAARRAALAEIGPPTLVRERVRDHGWEQWVASCAPGSPAGGTHAAADAAVHGDRGPGPRPRQRRGRDGVQRDERASCCGPLPGVGDPATLIALQPARRDGSTAEQIG